MIVFLLIVAFKSFKFIVFVEWSSQNDLLRFWQLFFIVKIYRFG